MLAPLSHALPQAFTGDSAVVHEAALLWPFLVLMQPLGSRITFEIQTGARAGRVPDALIVTATVKRLVFWVPSQSPVGQFSSRHVTYR